MATKKLSELINATPKQEEFLRVVQLFKFILYGGAAGGGKSYILQWFCVLMVLWAFVRHGVRNTKSGLFCSTYTALKDRHTSAWRIPRSLGKLSYTQNEGWVFKLKDKLGGGMVLLRNLDDPKKYDSAEFIAIGVDEWTENRWKTFDELQKRLRWAAVAGEPHLPCGGILKDIKLREIKCPIASHHNEPEWNFPFAMASNPGGVGHGETKKVFIDRDFPDNLKGSEQHFTYIQARVSDNPYNPRSYIEALMRLPEDMRRAYLDGDWNMFAGQYFTEWREELHTCEPFAIPSYWRRWMAGDWGEANPCCYLWFARDPEGTTYVTHEVYESGLTVDKQAERILAVNALVNPEVGRSRLDSACWDATGRSESIADQFRRNGVVWTPTTKGPGSRIQGWQRVKKLLHWERDETGRLTIAPTIKVFTTCRNLIRTVPSQVHDELKVEDLDSDAEDHAVDALRYGTEDSSPVTDMPVTLLPSLEQIALARAGHYNQDARP